MHQFRVSVVNKNHSQRHAQNEQPQRSKSIQKFHLASGLATLLVLRRYFQKDLLREALLRNSASRVALVPPPFQVQLNGTILLRIYESGPRPAQRIHPFPGASMKRKLLVAVPLLCMVALLAWIFRPKHESIGQAYISERSVTLWSGIAQVREQTGVLLYGDHVDVLARRNDYVKVRTATGLTGWVDGRYLMDPDLWQRSEKLLQQSKSMTVQAHGRTKVPTNLR